MFVAAWPLGLTITPPLGGIVAQPSQLLSFGSHGGQKKGAATVINRTERVMAWRSNEQRQTLGIPCASDSLAW